jgi:hypothetical protein
MARRRSKMSRNRRIGPGHNEANRQTRESRQREKMLDTGRESHFRFDIEELLVTAGLTPEEWRPFLQTLWTKGSRDGLDEAKAWVDEQIELDRVDAETGTKVKQYVQRYRTVR